MERINSSWFKDEEDVEVDVLGEENIYSEESRDNLLDDDVISLEEAAFMRGYEEAM